MLDKRTARMLENLIAVCGEGSYKIIEITDLVGDMSPRYKLDPEAIAQIIKHLTDREMIDVKYSDDKVYCIAVLPKGHNYDESKELKKREFLFSKRFAIITVISSFVAAFLGALLAHVIV